jgi:hypothetical protein
MYDLYARLSTYLHPNPKCHQHTPEFSINHLREWKEILLCTIRVLSWLYVRSIQYIGYDEQNTTSLMEANQYAGKYVNYTRFGYSDELVSRAADHLEQLQSFGLTCKDYARLQVQEETDRCIEVVGEFNRLIVELRNRHADVWDKNIAIETGSLE